MRVVVAGAGVLGSCIAVALARAGADVTVADPSLLGDNASGVAAGMLAPAFECLFDREPEHFDRLLKARDLWPEFAASVGIGLDRSGAIAVSLDEGMVESWRRTLSNFGVVAERLSPTELARAYPALAHGLRGVSLDVDWRLDARQALVALRAAGHRLGVALRPSALTRFTRGRGRFEDGSSIEADALIISTGASPSLTELAPELAGLTPIKGHILAIARADVGSRVVRFDGGYLCPSSGGVLLGATMEVGRADTAVESAQTSVLIATAQRYAPRLDYTAAAARVGVRASTANGWPIVGRSKTEGVWLAVGARRNGWLLAPTVARSIARDMSES